MTIKEETQADSVKGVRNFRSISEIENFYRFVYENDLRREAAMIFESVHAILKPARKKRTRKKKVQ